MMIFTITAQCRSKEMITPSVVRTVWKQRYIRQKQNVWASFHIPRRLQHSKMNEQTVKIQCRTNWKMIIILNVKPFNSLTAMGVHGRPHFNKLCSTVISCQIFIRSQSLITRWTRNDLSLPAVSRNFYEAFFINDVSIGSKSYLFCAS
jgi:hypothetical protein